MYIFARIIIDTCIYIVFTLNWTITDEKDMKLFPTKVSKNMHEHRKSAS